LLSWYDSNGRELPWRLRGARPDPYRVWLSEVMLQQTVAATVAPYYARFLELWPDVAALAEASREEVLAAWAGLGYYARARNLHAAAQTLARDGFPSDEAAWRALPGVGAYTAAAIAAIAFGQPANAVDGNVERVMARLFAVETALPAAKRELTERAATLVAADRPGDWAQALMDLGATICTPRAPKCDACPWAGDCAAYAGGAPETYPRRAAKAERPQRYGAAFRARRGDLYWLVRRPEQGLLAGMAALPTTAWRTTLWAQAEALEHAPFKATWRRVGQVRHVFTHFALILDVYEADLSPKNHDLGEGFWGDERALPSVFRKAAAL
jgi:A/G-specific adenine glycosylase